jgi:hypothetical protein
MLLSRYSLRCRAMVVACCAALVFPIVATAQAPKEADPDVKKTANETQELESALTSSDTPPAAGGKAGGEGSGAEDAESKPPQAESINFLVLLYRRNARPASIHARSIGFASNIRVRHRTSSGRCCLRSAGPMRKWNGR